MVVSGIPGHGCARRQPVGGLASPPFSYQCHGWVNCYDLQWHIWPRLRLWQPVGELAFPPILGHTRGKVNTWFPADIFLASSSLTASAIIQPTFGPGQLSSIIRLFPALSDGTVSKSASPQYKQSRPHSFFSKDTLQHFSTTYPNIHRHDQQQQ